MLISSVPVSAFFGRLYKFISARASSRLPIMRRFFGKGKQKSPKNAPLHKTALKEGQKSSLLFTEIRLDFRKYRLLSKKIRLEFQGNWYGTFYLLLWNFALSTWQSPLSASSRVPKGKRSYTTGVLYNRLNMVI